MNKLIIAFLLALFCTAAYGQTDSTKTKKRDLSVYATVADHLTHDGIDSLKATLLRAADSRASTCCASKQRATRHALLPSTSRRCTSAKATAN